MNTEICLRYLADKCQQIYFVPKRKNYTTFSDTVCWGFILILSCLPHLDRVDHEHSNKGNKTQSNVSVCF